LNNGQKEILNNEINGILLNKYFFEKRYNELEKEKSYYKDKILRLKSV